mmetsp:Transcript_21391/g.52852  ORF Transcript_21391/g.52852 Transcript_21391/m.52852 type:complete len:229 (+) Transcript_21391:1187-1873(+)
MLPAAAADIVAGGHGGVNATRGVRAPSCHTRHRVRSRHLRVQGRAAAVAYDCRGLARVATGGATPAQRPTALHLHDAAGQGGTPRGLGSWADAATCCHRPAQVGCTALRGDVQGSLRALHRDCRLWSAERHAPRQRPGGAPQFRLHSLRRSVRGVRVDGVQGGDGGRPVCGQRGGPGAHARPLQGAHLAGAQPARPAGRGSWRPAGPAQGAVQDGDAVRVRGGWSNRN